MNPVARRLITAALAVAIVTIGIPADAGLVAYPPGTTKAVLSYISETDVEIVRHWPDKPQDVTVAPWTAQWWNSCWPGDGAIMFLITAPIDLPPLWALVNPSYYEPDTIAKKLLPMIVGKVTANAQRISDEKIRQALTDSLLPGSYGYEEIKAALSTEIRSMGIYQRYGYAVFLFIKGKWVCTLFCVPTCVLKVDAVPEGYGIDHVK